MLPFIRLSDEILLPSYMLVLSLTYCVGLVFAFYRAGADDEKRNTALDLALAIMIGGFVGARLLHVFYEQPTFYFENPAEAFKFWRGGFVYYGGFIGALVACWLYVRWKKLSFLEWADFYAPVISLGYALGRLGCLLNGCCFGEICDLPWAIEFNFPGLPTGLRHPTAIYASVYELCVFAFLIAAEKRPLRVGQLFGLWLLLHAQGRIFMELFRADDRGPAIFSLSISTWLSLAVMVIALATLLPKKIGRTKAP